MFSAFLLSSILYVTNNFCYYDCIKQAREFIGIYSEEQNHGIILAILSSLLARHYRGRSRIEKRGAIF